MDIKIKLTIKACCLFEQMTGKSFFRCETTEDVIHMLYAMYVVTNDSTMSYQTFLSVLENKRVARALMVEYNNICKFLEQMKLSEQINKYNEGGTGGEGEEMNITKLATSLIVLHGLDPGYVMEKMQIWEIIPYFECADSKRKMELVDKRFWTYLTILPHVDGKKIKSPESLFKFDWEKGKKDKYAEDLEKKSEFIKAFFEAQKKRRQAKEEEENGE